jgi:hypothetical protein
MGGVMAKKKYNKRAATALRIQRKARKRRAA